jgi:predicted Zn-ribbon and HTH transcriptional regulator
MKKMKAIFKCLGCGYEYKAEPGPTECPKCKHIWIKWVNYEEWRKWNKSTG